MGARYTKVGSSPSAARNLKDLFGRMGTVTIRNDLRIALNLKAIEIYYCFRLFRVESKFSIISADERISSLDFWSTIIFLSKGSVDEKINSSCKLIDLNDSGFISHNNLLILFICTTRGIAKFKGFEFIPVEKLEKTVIDIFASNAKVLNENGELSIFDLREFMKQNDVIRTYLNNLGSKVEEADPSALAGKRTNLLKDLSAVQAEIERTAHLLDAIDEDELAFARERGGDIKLLRLNENPTLEDFKSTYVNRSLSSSFQSLLNNDRNETSTVPANHPSKYHFRKVDAYADAEAFLDARAGKPVGTSKNVFGDNFRNSLFQVWNKLPHDEGGDGTAFLDEYTLIGLFDNVGIYFPFSEAKRCLAYLQSQLSDSQLHRYSFNDVLRWFRIHGAPNLKRDENSSSSAKHWLEFCKSASEVIKSVTERMKHNLEVLTTQRRLLKRIDAMPKQSFSKNFSLFKSSQHALSHPSDKKPNTSKIQMSKDLAFLLSLHEFLNKSMSKDPTNVNFKFNFGSHSLSLNVPPPSSPSKSIQSKKTAILKSKQQSKAAKEEESKWKLKFKLFFSVNPFAEITSKSVKPVSKLRKVDGMCSIKDFANLHCTDILSYFNDISLKLFDHKHENDSVYTKSDESHTTTHNNTHELASQNSSNKININNVNIDMNESTADQSTATSPSRSSRSSFRSVMWLTFQLKPDLSRAQELLLSTTLSNLFNSIPLHHRRHLYTAVYVDVFAVVQSTGNETNEAAGVKSPHTETNKWMELLSRTKSANSLPTPQGNKSTKVALVALLNERDYFQEVERLLVELDIFLSRSFTKGSLELNLTESFRDVFAHSSKFHCFDEKLFGPQEVDLGEEGMNPLKYAKELRHRKSEAVGYSQQAAKLNMKRDELSKHCRLLGIQDKGSLSELSLAVAAAYAQQAELMGHDELSKFGEGIIEKIFSSFKSSSDGKNDSTGLSLWDFNQFLDAIGSSTIYDNKDYKNFMGLLQLFTDRDSHLMVEGLKAYYLKSGRLGDDNSKVGIGSLVEMLHGNLLLNFNYSPDALASMFNLVGSNPLLKHKIIEFVNMLSATKEVKIESDLSMFSQLFELLEMLEVPFAKVIHREILGTPGWLAAFVNSICEYLADGSSGVIPSIRNSVLKSFGKYHDFEKEFTLQLNEKVTFSLEQDETLKDLEKKLYEVDDEFEENEEQIRDLIHSFQQRQDEIIQAVTNEFIPKLSNSVEIDHHKNLTQMKEDLLFLSEIQYDTSVHLTSIQSNDISERKKLLTNLIERTEIQMKENGDLLAAHSCAAYDAVRLLTDSTPNVGFGTVDLCVRGLTTGFDWVHLLPKGAGEYAPLKLQRHEKLERAKNRKSAALAALERERLRRNMTEEEKEKARLEQMALQQEQWDIEEQQLVEEALELLFIAREERLSTAELTELMALWENILDLKEKRYPKHLKCCICQSNLGCILLEFYGPSHPIGSNASFLFESAVKCIMDTSNSDQETEDAFPGSRILKSGIDEDEENKLSAERAAIAMLLLNHISFLLDTESHSQLKQAFMVKCYIFELFNSLTESDKAKLTSGVVGDVFLMPVLCFRSTTNSNVQKVLQLVINEVQNNLEERARLRKEEEEWMAQQAVLEAELAVVAERQSQKDDDSLPPPVKSAKQLRLEKQDKYEEQRKLAADKRSETTKKRQIMYGMIQSNEITAVFEARAQRAENLEQPKWGADTEKVQQAVKQFSAVSGKEKDDHSKS